MTKPTGKRKTKKRKGPTGRTSALLARASKLANDIESEELALLSVSEHTEYNKKGKGKWKIHVKPLKKKGGHQSTDFTAIELLADLKMQLRKDWPDLKTVARNYMMLRSMTKR